MSVDGYDTMHERSPYFEMRTNVAWCSLFPSLFFHESRQSGQTALIRAAAKGSVDVVSELLAAKAIMEAKDKVSC